MNSIAIKTNPLIGLPLIIFTLLIPASVQAQNAPLPEPLTLEAALGTASNPDHFEIALISQKINEIQALVGVEESDSGFSVDLKGRLRRVGVSDAGNPDEDGDSAASLLVSKPLYDFGIADTRLNVLNIEKQVLLLERQRAVEQRRLLIMEKYFDVLNADNEFISENEDLAIGFIRFDRARENMQLGSSSAIEVSRLQSEYERIRQRRYLAENQQRLTRMVLAETMGYPQHLPSTLESPDVDIDKPLYDDVEALTEWALTHSSEAKLLNARSRLAEYAIQQADTIGSPRLDFELELSSYERESSIRDDWRASIYFDVPLYSGAKTSGLAVAHSRHRQSLAEVSKYQSQIRFKVLQLWQSIQQNRLVSEGAMIEQSYRDLYLDRSRAEYELEFSSDLGDAMVQFSRARTERLKALYAFELAYNRLLALVGAELLQTGSAIETQ